MAKKSGKNRENSKEIPEDLSILWFYFNILGLNFLISLRENPKLGQKPGN